MAFRVENLAKRQEEKKPWIPRGVGLVISGVAAILFALRWAVSLRGEYLVVSGLPLPSAWSWFFMAWVGFVGAVFFAAGISLHG